jgi:hypothetical protein
VLIRAGFDYDENQQQFLRRSEGSGGNELLLSCRQYGKSTVCAGLAVSEVLLAAGTLVLAFGPTQRQSAEPFKKAVSIYDTLARPVPETRRTSTDLELANGSRLVSLPGKAANVRGFSRPKLVIVDEAAFVADELIAAVRPMLARSRGRLVLASSAYGQRGEFYRAWTSGTDWRKTRVTADQCPAISPAFLAAERQALGLRWYMQEYFGVFSAVVDAVFDPAAVEAALEAGVRPLFLGAAA